MVALNRTPTVFSLVAFAVLVVLAPLLAFGLHGASVIPDRLDFGLYELASPVREARVKLGPDETPAVKSVTFVPVKGGNYDSLRSAARRVEQKILDKAAVRSRRASGMGFDGG